METALILRMVAKERSWLEEAMADPEKAMAELEKQPVPGYENLPTVSVQPRTLIFVKFLGEPEPKVTKTGKNVAYASVELLAPTDQGWDPNAKERISLSKGEKCSINLKRHVGLWAAAQANAPLTEKSVCIANLGKVKTKKGSACNYRWKELT